MSTTFLISPNSSAISEADVQAHAASILGAAGYTVKHHKSGNVRIDKSWPSKTKSGKGRGFPDTLLFSGGNDLPMCVWENKNPSVKVDLALDEAKFYIEGLHTAMALEPALPRIAVGFNGIDSIVEYYTPERKWVPVKSDGKLLVNEFPNPELLLGGIDSSGNFIGRLGFATIQDLRDALKKLKTIYRLIPVLSSGRNPVDFTVALLTLKLLLEQNVSWGTWAEQPALVPGAASESHAVAERLVSLVDRILADPIMKAKYGDIFDFKDSIEESEINFKFKFILSKIDRHKNSFSEIFKTLDSLPPLEHANFDIFGEVFQWIGDESTKKALGEFFTGRHIISSVVPILLERSGGLRSMSDVEKLKIGDIACGTGGFLTEALRYIKKTLSLSDAQTREISKKVFFGYDLGYSNASRARVNMYFAGDGFSEIKGGFDSLAKHSITQFPADGFDFILTNPPYGKSSYGRAEEAFLSKVIEILKPGAWGMIVLPAGVVENPRSSAARYMLLRSCKVTDIISLPKHAFAPYTQQKTVIVVFQKRIVDSMPLSEEWSGLSLIENEKISMYVVDNDGYANSDKRYPTDRKSIDGSWLHDELSRWVDPFGNSRPSHLHAALIDEVEPPFKVNEFNKETGKKYGRFRLMDLRDKDRGVNLLPEASLRPKLHEIDYYEYVKRAQSLIDYYDRKTDNLECGILSEAEYLMGVNLIYPAQSIMIKSTINDIFELTKGDQSLSEAIIYRYYEEDGLPVYGGGVESPKYRISESAVTGNGKEISIHEGPSIVLAMDGSSGAMTVIGTGKFSANHHALVLRPNDEKFQLYWFKQQMEQSMRNSASNKGASATLTLPFVKSAVVEVPIKAIRDEINNLRRRLEEIRKRLHE